MNGPHAILAGAERFVAWGFHDPNYLPGCAITFVLLMLLGWFGGYTEDLGYCFKLALAALATCLFWPYAALLALAAIAVTAVAMMFWMAS